MKKYCVIKITDSYTVCVGSGLYWADEARSMVLSEMLNDVKTVEDEKLQNVSLFELEANDTGLGISYDCNGMRTRYYILEEPEVDI